MTLRVGWDIYETAILLDACVQIDKGNCDKKIMIKNVSIALRNRAISNGAKIDKLFRNENGITLQMIKMLYLVTAGEKGLPGSGKIFVEIAVCIKTNLHSLKEYLNVLKNNYIH